MTKREEAIEAIRQAVQERRFADANNGVSRLGRPKAGDTELLGIRAGIAVGMKSWQEAILLLEKVLPQIADGEEAQRRGFQLADAYRRGKQYDKAANALRPFLTEDNFAARRELARIVGSSRKRPSKGSAADAPVFMAAASEIVGRVAGNANSVVELADAEWSVVGKLAGVPERFAIDKARPYEGEGVTSAQSSFTGWKTEKKKFDVGVALLSLDKIGKPEKAAARLLRFVSVAIVAVDCKVGGKTRTPEDAVAGVEAWFERPVNFSYTATEIDGHARVICVLDRRSKEQWPGIADDRLLFRWSLRGAETLLGTSAD